MAAPPRSHRPSRRSTLLVLFIVLVVGGIGAIVTDTLRAGWAFGRVVAHVNVLLNPPPDRVTAITVASTPRPRSGGGEPSDSTAPVASAAIADPSASGASAGSSLTPSASVPASSGVASAGTSPSPLPSPTAAATAAPVVTPRPQPTRGPVDVSIVKDAYAVFAHELTKNWCAVAATQTVLTILGKGNSSDAFQREIAGRIGEWESRRDSHDGNWGPGAIVLALKAYGVAGYEVRAYQTRDDALIDAALAISDTHKPVLLLTWRGAHTWVMTGYKADADPNVYPDARLTHAQILDPWYPFVSSIWGASHRPGFYQTMAEMQDNYLPWARPEGAYPDRDGMFIAVVPTTPR